MAEGPGPGQRHRATGVGAVTLRRCQPWESLSLSRSDNEREEKKEKKSIYSPPNVSMTRAAVIQELAATGGVGRAKRQICPCGC